MGLTANLFEQLAGPLSEQQPNRLFSLVGTCLFPSDGFSLPGYTFGMKTAVSIPDDLFAQADMLADRLGKSRSEIYREALADYVARREPGAVTRALNEVAEELVGERDEFSDESARRILEQTEW